MKIPQVGKILFALLLAVGGITLLFADIPPVVLTWETASEVGTAGFNVYRARDFAHDFKQVNPTLVPARGDEVIGATYRFEDSHVVTGRRYIYRIEEVEWDGTVNAYPETVRVRAGLPPVWTKAEGLLLLLLAFAFFWRTLKQ